MNTAAIKKSIQKNNNRIKQLKDQSEKINAELKSLDEKTKTLSSILKRQEAIDKEFESLYEERPVKKKSSAAPTAPAEESAAEAKEWLSKIISW